MNIASASRPGAHSYALSYMRVVLCESGRGLPDTEGHVRSLSLVASQMCWRPVGRVPREIRTHRPGDHVLNGAGVRIGVPQRVVDGLSADGARKLVAGSVFAYGLECSCAAVPFPFGDAAPLCPPGTTPLGYHEAPSLRRVGVPLACEWGTPHHLGDTPTPSISTVSISVPVIVLGGLRPCPPSLFVCVCGGEAKIWEKGALDALFKQV